MGKRIACCVGQLASDSYGPLGGCGAALCAGCWLVVGFGPGDRGPYSVCVPQVLGPENQTQTELTGQKPVRRSSERQWAPKFSGGLD